MKVPNLASACAALALGAQAQPAQTIVRDLAAPVAVTSVTSFGAPETLIGATVTAYFSNGTSEQAELIRAGNAVGAGSHAYLLTDRFYVFVTPRDLGLPGRWQISNRDNTASLMGFTLNGRGFGAGAVGFDVSSAITTEDTPGSLGGVELQPMPDWADNGHITITYLNPLALNGAPAAGDLFAQVRVDLDFSETVDGGLAPASDLYTTFYFTTDVDVVAYAPVPEPASALLLLAGAALLRARRR